MIWADDDTAEGDEPRACACDDDGPCIAHFAGSLLGYDPHELDVATEADRANEDAAEDAGMPEPGPEDIEF